ncbi:unnamed protein product [Closterium sp. Yama58-4]|nr:unnamed protein product [Closterium sp. Yama58-4]
MLLTLSASSIPSDSLASRSASRRPYSLPFRALSRAAAPGKEGPFAAFAPRTCAMTAAAPIADDLRALDGGARLAPQDAGKNSANLAERRDEGAQQSRGECSHAEKRKLSASADAECRIGGDAAAAPSDGTESKADSTRSAEPAAKRPRGSADHCDKPPVAQLAETKSHGGGISPPHALSSPPAAAPHPAHAAAAAHQSPELAPRLPWAAPPVESADDAAAHPAADAAAKSGESGGAGLEEEDEAEGEEGEAEGEEAVGGVTAADGGACGKKKRYRYKRLSKAGYIPDDGQHWHKYGQKNLVDAGYCRAYYRCARRSAGCAAKKTIDFPIRWGLDMRVTYSGQHTHGLPPRLQREVFTYATTPAQLPPNISVPPNVLAAAAANAATAGPATAGAASTAGGATAGAATSSAASAESNPASASPSPNSPPLTASSAPPAPAPAAPVASAPAASTHPAASAPPALSSPATRAAATTATAAMATTAAATAAAAAAAAEAVHGITCSALPIPPSRELHAAATRLCTQQPCKQPGAF